MMKILPFRQTGYLLLKTDASQGMRRSDDEYFAKITWKTMKQNRTRTLVTILWGWLVRGSFFTALIVFCTSLFSFWRKPMRGGTEIITLGWNKRTNGGKMRDSRWRRGC